MRCQGGLYNHICDSYGVSARKHRRAIISCCRCSAAATVWAKQSMQDAFAHLTAALECSHLTDRRRLVPQARGAIQCRRRRRPRLKHGSSSARRRDCRHAGGCASPTGTAPPLTRIQTPAPSLAAPAAAPPPRTPLRPALTRCEQRTMTWRDRVDRELWRRVGKRAARPLRRPCTISAVTCLQRCRVTSCIAGVRHRQTETRHVQVAHA